MKWSAFTTAIEDLEWFAGVYEADGQQDVARDFRTYAEAIRQSIKFYLPNGAKIIGKRPYMEFDDLLHLPFDSLAILSESTISESGNEDDPGAVPVATLTVAISKERVDKFFGEYLNTQQQVAWPGDFWCAFFSLAREQINGELRWYPSGSLSRIKKSSDAMESFMVKTALSNQVFNQMAENYGSPERAAEQMQLETAPDVDVLVNLCVMLGLKNVRTREVAAPLKVNAKRIKTGKMPLWSYHVLEVDGDVWSDDDATRGPASEREYRSHLRRGHVRRLEDGRRIWVRAAFVHGKIDGFVSKDYQVKDRDVASQV